MGFYIGIDVGGTNIKIAVTDEKNNILSFKSMPVKEREVSGSYSRQASAETVREITCSLITDMINRHCIHACDVLSVGIGIPGIIEGIKGPVVFTPNLGLCGIDFITEISGYLTACGNSFSKDIFYMANDADCAGLAEALMGAGAGFGNVLVLTLGTGVGGSFISNGKPVSFGKYGGEFGHFHFSNDGPMCRCGIKGCFEQYANSAGFKRLGFEKYTDALAEGLAGFINIFRPDIIVLAGGVINEGEKLFDSLNTKLSSFVYAAEFTNVPKIIPAGLGAEAGALGAALFGRMSQDDTL